MPTGRSFRDSARFATLIVLALLMKALVPAGWMPVFEDGAVALRLCSGWAPVPAQQPAAQDHQDMAMGHDAGASSGHHDMAMDHGASASSDHHDQHDEGPPSPDQPCSFAAAGFSWTAPDTGPAAEPLPPGQSLASPPLTAVAVGRGLAAPPPPQTGPPLLT